jgi:hypothetical protein
VGARWVGRARWAGVLGVREQRRGVLLGEYGAAGGASVLGVKMTGTRAAALVVMGWAALAGGCSGAEGPSDVVRLAVEGVGWRWTGPMNEPRSGHGAALLDDTRVMVLGGYDRHSLRTASVEVYDSVTNVWSLAMPLTHYRAGNTAVQVGPGKVFVAGGDPPPELYDAETDSWEDIAWSGPPRENSSATLLADGRVLLLGGTNNNGFVHTGDVFDPESRAVESVSGPPTPRLGHTATVLVDGRVLVTGGSSEMIGYVCMTSAEVFEPATKTWGQTAALAEARCYGTATLLPDGRVLVAGGFSEASPFATASAELYDPQSQHWKAASPMKRARYLHTATLLKSGLVLVAGGGGERALKYAELYDPETDTWSETTPMGDVRQNHTATLLPSGEVVVAGTSAEVYGPVSDGGCAAVAAACPEPVGNEGGAGGAGGQGANAAGAMGGEATVASGGERSAAGAAGTNAAAGGETSTAIAGAPNEAVAGEVSAAAGAPSGAVGGAGEAGRSSEPAAPSDGGCSCRQVGARSTLFWGWPALALLLGSRRKRWAALRGSL